MKQKNVIEEIKKPLRYMFKGNEKDFEGYIHDNIIEICEGLGLPPVRWIARQKTLIRDGVNIRPDIVVRHTDETMTVFEVKKVNEKAPATGANNQMNAIGQLLLYKTILTRQIGAPVRLVLIDNKIYYKTFFTVTDNRLPITLVELQNDRVFAPYVGWSEKDGE